MERRYLVTVDGAWKVQRAGIGAMIRDLVGDVMASMAALVEEIGS